ncbi:uncharacterized protein LOC115769242 [Drosophila novamexicana]|uniref:uncharacterized protein LOC115769242 n=1 Tax=Drosophila novamexicana TaxID=47314 RepID=UPI0011E5D377|nr:uncharacterized protein LOC115769242 [Drosophila novamexicana]
MHILNSVTRQMLFIESEPVIAVFRKLNFIEMLSKVLQTTCISVVKYQNKTSSCGLVVNSTNKNNINFLGIMRSNNGQQTVQRYRVINNNKKLQIIGKAGLSTTQRQSNKRFIQTKLRGRASQNFSPQHEYQEDDLSAMSDMEYLTEPERDQADNQERAFQSIASTVRPLLQLFSEDSCSPKKNVSSLHSTTVQDALHDKRQIIYKDIPLSSEEEDEDRASLHEEERNLFLEDEAIVACPRLDSLSRFEWSPKSTNIFLDLWEKHLKDIRGPLKKSLIHKEMAEEMSEYGPTHREIKTKMDNMSRKYRLEMKKIKSGKPTNWRYFKRVQALLVGTPSVDFEEIIFDNTESSTFFNADSSDAEPEVNNMSAEDREPEQETAPAAEPEQVPEEEERVDKNVEQTPAVLPRSHRDDFYSTPRGEPTERMMHIEEQKLAVEKEKLQVMKHISRELTSIGQTLIELLRNAK